MKIEPSVRGAREEAEAWGTPLLIGEFGVAPIDGPVHTQWMQTQGQLHDRYFASSVFWLWKEASQDSWGLFDHDATTGAWTERPHVVAWVSRVRVARIAGTPVSVESTASGDAIRVELRPGTATAAPHVVFVPERFAGSFVARCDGAVRTSSRDPATGLLEVPCTGVLEVGAELPGS